MLAGIVQRAVRYGLGNPKRPPVHLIGIGQNGADSGSSCPQLYRMYPKTAEKK